MIARVSRHHQLVLQRGGLALSLLLTAAGSLPVMAQLPPARIAPATQMTFRPGDGSYRLGVGDRLRLDIFNVPEYSGEQQVLSDGSLNLPIVGAVRVQGLSLTQASDLIAARYAGILRRPIITLSLVQTRPVTIAIAGEVNRPGSYTLAASNDATVPSLTQALQVAGGITQSANVRQIQIRRPSPGYLGSSQSVTVDLWRLRQEADLSQDLLLQDGDMIVVPTATVVNLQEARLLANSSFAASPNQSIQVAVVGQVNRPGPYSLAPGADSGSSQTDRAQIPTVTKAIQAAGGITQVADIRNIQVRRATHRGEEQAIAVNFWQLLQSGDLQQDVPLQEGDTIIIPTATTLTPAEITELASASFAADQMTVNVVGEVGQPGAVQVPPNTPLNQALLAAGGFNTRARRGRVELIRLNIDGTVSRREIAVDFDQGMNEASNPSLRPNDTIVVGRSGLTSVSDTLGTLLSPITGVFSLFRLLGL